MKIYYYLSRFNVRTHKERALKQYRFNDPARARKKANELSRLFDGRLCFYVNLGLGDK